MEEYDTLDVPTMVNLKSVPFMRFFLPLYIVNTSTHSVSSLNLLVFGFHPNQQQSSSASSFFSLFFFLFVFETLSSPMACLEVCKEVTINRTYPYYLFILSNIFYLSNELIHFLTLKFCCNDKI